MSDDRDRLEPGEEAGLRAAEYVLGVLSPLEARAMEAAAAEDAELAGQIAWWEQRLGPLTDLVRPVPAPAVLWRRLALATGIDSGAQAGVVQAAPEPRRGSPASRQTSGQTSGQSSGRASGLGLGWWRAATAGSMAVAAGLAFLLMSRAPAPAPLLAALSPYGQPGATFLVRVGANGAATVVAVGDTHVLQGRALELWAVAGTAAPVSMGLLPPNGRADLTIPMGAGTQLLVSDEPAGGSPVKGPTGPVVFGGTLTPL